MFLKFVKNSIFSIDQVVSHLVENIVEGGLQDKSTGALVLLAQVGDNSLFR